VASPTRAVDEARDAGKKCVDKGEGPERQRHHYGSGRAIHRFNCKEGMMVYRFSVASNAQRLIKNAAGELINHQVYDVLYETFVTPNSSLKRKP
jgi:hypothetical protein